MFFSLIFALKSESKSIKKELLEYFRFSIDTPSASAFCQQRKKILLEVFCENLHVTGEADLLKTVILNLIDNSVKAIEGKKESDYKGKIRICGTESPDEILLTVEDNGKGIPGEEIHRVTESFYMVDKSRKYENGNAGLGLSICQRVLELHHAELILESQVGEGTRAKILFRRDEG